MSEVSEIWINDQLQNSEYEGVAEHLQGVLSGIESRLKVMNLSTNAYEEYSTNSAC
jgi:hypothetical protein